MGQLSLCKISHMHVAGKPIGVFSLNLTILFMNVVAVVASNTQLFNQFCQLLFSSMFSPLFFPGINATCATRLESSKPELRQLKKVTDIDKRKLKGLANKEMVDEILKVKKMTKELKKYQRGRGRGRGRKRSQANNLCEVFGQELDAKTLRTSQLNGTIIEKTLLSELDCQTLNRDSGITERGRKSLGRQRKNGLMHPLSELDESEVSRLTRTTRTHGVLDECVSVLKEGCVWKITFSSEKKQNALTTEVGFFYGVFSS